ncbi:MAG TPA: NAD-dependent epimerase/dehydratase family protein [Pseudonocardiaceae bacterium]|nr:NAD-dependent epimerase/dehydratase family protein [Pseudonocardiaceae bacterium]
MRVIILGGTRFVGRAITTACVAAGHDALVVHRGEHEPDDLADVDHLHLDRAAWPDHRKLFGADAAVDVSAGNADGARAALTALPSGITLVALSSVDVYRAYEGLHTGRQTDVVPLTETSPLRAARHLDGPQWENLDIEQHYLQAGAAVLRLGAVYGEHDYQRRFEPVLRRVRGGRARMPVGAGDFLFSRVYVGDVARAVLAALDTPAGAGECFNIVEAQTAPIRLFFEQVIAAASADLELVRVPDAALPPDLRAAGALDQHLLASPAKAQRVLHWQETDREDNVRRSVHWHLDD